MNLRTEKFYWKSAISGNSTTFIAFLHQMRQNFPNKNILFIVDNANIHRSKKIKSFLEKYREITLYHLPTYSPEYNPVEKVWWWLKPKIYGLFAFKNGLEELLSRTRKLIMAYNKGQLNLKIYREIIEIKAD
ncbi:MAG: transposase [Bacteroidota bacterium]|nr:transposase [Bacteroidota bacterium]